MIIVVSLWTSYSDHAISTRILKHIWFFCLHIYANGVTGLFQYQNYIYFYIYYYHQSCWHILTFKTRK